MYNKIVLAGGSGYLGHVLAEYYAPKAKEIVILSRSPHPSAGVIRYETWDGRTEGKWASALENADLLVNLSGKSVNCRYTEQNRKEILDSRIGPTSLLGRVINKMAQPPRAWINFASATIYRHAEDHSQDETHGEIGEGFSIEVCKAWEESFVKADTPRTKKIILRVGIVLGNKEGALPSLKNLVKVGFGGRQGNGRQYVSWIHEHDVARITEWALEHAADSDVFNVTAPNAITNTGLMKLLRKAYHRPVGLPMPAWLLKMGAVMIGTETELILKSRWVYPARLLAAGFVFDYPDAASAISELSGVEV
jgi:uncharacterized protein (TIGR01777 family)